MQFSILVETEYQRTEAETNGQKRTQLSYAACWTPTNRFAVWLCSIVQVVRPSATLARVTVQWTRYQKTHFDTTTVGGFFGGFRRYKGKFET
jgi:hypothetical protein